MIKLESTMETLSSREVKSASPTKVRWELDWEAPDKILKIEMFSDDTARQKRGVSNQIREKILGMEASMAISGLVRQNSRRRASRQENRPSSGKMLALFRCVVRSVVLLLKCFKPRKKIAIHSGQVTYTNKPHHASLTSSERSSLRPELQLILSMSPIFRTESDIRKVMSYLRAIGAMRAVLGHPTFNGEKNISRYVSYERYENGRMLAQQGRPLDRFYYVMSGKILLVNEYHVGNSVISKTAAVLGKGDTTDSDEMLKNSTRRCSMICRGSAEVLVIDRDDYMTICDDKRDGAREYLSKHHLLKLFPSEILRNDGIQLQLKYYKEGEVVFSGGHKYDWVYVIKSGECAMVRTQLVSDVLKRKRALFSHRNSQELGCERMSRRRNETMAGFRMWRRQVKNPLWERKKRNQSMTNLLPVSNAQGGSTIVTDVTTKQHDPTTSKDKSTNLPPITNGVRKDEPKPVYSGLNPIDASMAGVRVQTNNLLSKSRMTALTPRGSESNRQLASKQRKSAPPTLRRAHLELGKLKSGDVFGLDDLYGSSEEVTRIALLSNGAEVVRIKRGFFLRHAPANLLIKLSTMSHDFPTIGEARESLEAVETWSLYKDSLLKLLTSERKTCGVSTNLTSQSKSLSRKQRTTQEQNKRYFAIREALSAPAKHYRGPMPDSL